MLLVLFVICPVLVPVLGWWTLAGILAAGIYLIKSEDEGHDGIREAD